MIFHKHNWVEKLRTYQPSELEVAKNNGLTEFYPYGDYWKSYTVILWECSVCQKLRQEKVLGNLINSSK